MTRTGYVLAIILALVFAQAQYIVPGRPAAAAAGGITLGNLNYDGTGSSDTFRTISKPAGCSDGDVFVGFITKDDDDAITPPTDTTHPWVEIDHQYTSTGDDLAVGAWYKIVTTCASETETDYTWTWSTAEASIGAVQILSGVDTGTPEDVANGYVFLQDDQSPEHTSITTNTNNALVFAMIGIGTINGIQGDGTMTHPSGSTEIVDESTDSGGGAHMAIAYFTQVTAGATGVQEWVGVAEVNYDSHLFLMAFRPAS